MSVNKVILIGNLGRDPEIRYSANGTTVGNINIATTHRSKGPDGNTYVKAALYTLKAAYKLVNGKIKAAKTATPPKWCVKTCKC